VHSGFDLDVDVQVQIESELQGVFSASTGRSLRSGLSGVLGDLTDLPKCPSDRVGNGTGWILLHQRQLELLRGLLSRLLWSTAALGRAVTLVLELWFW
jgi:hypothetical protein